jgi:hypothetical protein
MKFIKKFESFHETGVDEGDSVVPKHNPKRQTEIRSFLGELTPSNKHRVFLWLKKEVPSYSDPEFDNKFEKAKEELIDYLEENPNIRIDKIDIENFSIPSRGGDGVPRVQNIGGSSQTNSFRIGQ